MQEINHQLRNPNPFMANYTAFNLHCDLDFNCQIPFLIYTHQLWIIASKESNGVKSTII